MKFEKFERDFYFNHDVNIRHEGTKLLPPHYHNRFEVYFITEGECTYFINNKSYALQKGDIALIPAGVIHNTKYAGSVHSRMLINCSEEYIPTSVLPVLPSLLYLYRCPDALDDIQRIFEKIELEYRHPDKLTEDILRCYTYNLFFTMARNKSVYSDQSTKSQTLERAIDHIQNSLSAPLSLSSVAKSVGVSPEHFSRMFKKETGFGFSKYLSTARLQRAKALLTQANGASISQIAGECGFEDSNYFSKKFKEKYGISPKKLQTLAKIKAL